MIKKIEVKVDTGHKMCGRCRFLKDEGCWCTLFLTPVFKAKHGYERALECIQSEAVYDK